MGRKNSISDAKFESFNKCHAQTLVLEPILHLYSMQHMPDGARHVRTVNSGHVWCEVHCSMSHVHCSHTREACSYLTAVPYIDISGYLPAWNCRQLG